MLSEVKKLNLFDFDVQVTEPLINVSHVLLFNIFEFIAIKVKLTLNKRKLELALIYLEISIDKRKGTPSSNDIFGCRLRRKVNKLKHDNI